MNKEEIIEMARQAGMELYGLGKDREMFVHHLTAFATLVASAERDACAKIADQYVGQDLEHNFSALVAHNIRARGNHD